MAGGHARAFVGEDGTGQHDRGNLLRAGLHRVTLQDGGPAQLPFDLANIDLVLPSS
jgi:hypothetical protein